MRRYLKPGAIALAVVAILAVVVGTTLAFADSPDEDATGGGPRDVFIGKVAESLGLDDEQVAEAFKDAVQDMIDEALLLRLDKAVEEGIITEGEATEIMDWLNDRPEALKKLGPPGGRLQMRDAWQIP